MDALTKAGKLWDTYKDVAELLTQARPLFADSRALLDALEEYALKPAGSKLESLATQLGINQARVKEWLAAHDDVVKVLLGNVKSLDQRTFSWGGSAGAKVGAGGMIELGAGGELALGFDCDGSLLDDVLTSDKEREGFVSLTAGATVKGKGVASAITGVSGVTLTAKLAFGVDAQVEFANHFLVQQSASALDAVASATRNLCLPGNPAGLLAQRRAGAGGISTPTQWVHLRGTDAVSFAGSLNVSTLFVEVKNGRLAGVDTLASVSAGVTLDASFTYAHQGTFDLLVCASPANDDMVRVSVTRARSSKRGVGFNASLGASIDTTGLSEVAKKVADAVLPPEVRAVFEKLQDPATAGSALKSAVESKLSGKIDAVLNDNKFVSDLDAWVKALDGAADVKGAARDALMKIGVKLTNAAFASAATHVTDWTRGLVSLFKAYADKVDQLQKLIEKAARIKIGLHYSRQRVELDNALSAIVVDIDPARAPAVYRAAIHGDFQAVLASRGTPGVHVVDGHLVTGGNDQVTVDCGVSFFGLTAGAGSILTQDWNCETTASGDVRIGVESSLENWSDVFGKYRSLTFFTSTNLVAAVGGANGLLGVSQNSRVHLELEDRFKAKENRLEEYAGTLKALGVVVADSARMIHEIHEGPLVAPGIAVTGLVSLEFTPSHIERILTADEAMLRGVFAQGLVDNTVLAERLRTRDGAHRFVFDWQLVRDTVATGDLRALESKALESAGTRVTVTATEWAVALEYCIVLNRFVAMIGQLRSFRSQSLLRPTEQATITAIRDAHRSVLSSVSDVVGFFDRRGANAAMFATLFRLADDGSLDPFAILERADGETFVYGQEDRQ